MKSESTIKATKDFTYSSYRDLVIHLSETGSTTGAEQTPERIEATKLNAHRMKRIEKQIQVKEDLILQIKKIKRKLKWTVLVESWCGDGAQIVPVIAKMASLNSNIEFKIILRDENLDIMDKHLTNGARSIPILICEDELTNKEIGVWGSRPKKITEMARYFKLLNPRISHDEFIKHLHLWYAKDRGEAIQNDFRLLIPSWNK